MRPPSKPYYITRQELRHRDHQGRILMRRRVMADELHLALEDAPAECSELVQHCFTRALRKAKGPLR